MKKCYEKDLEYFSYKKANVLQNYSKIKFILKIEFVMKNKKNVEKCYEKDLEYFSYKKKSSYVWKKRLHTKNTKLDEKDYRKKLKLKTIEHKQNKKISDVRKRPASGLSFFFADLKDIL